MINVKNIKRVRRGFQPRSAVVLEVLLLALLKFKGAFSANDYESLAYILRAVAQDKKCEMWPWWAPVDMVAFKAVWDDFNFQGELYKKGIIVTENEGEIHIFYE